MPDLYNVKNVYVPGLMDGNELAEQMKLLKQQKVGEQKVAPPPEAAYQRADEIIRDFVPSIPAVPAVTSAQPRSRAAAKLSPEQVAQEAQVQERGGMIADAINRTLDFNPIAPGLGSLLGLINETGTLSPEESAEATQLQVEQAKQEEATLKKQQDLSYQRMYAQEEKQRQLGLPVTPSNQLDLTARGQALVNDINKRREAAAKVAMTEATPVTQTWWLNAAQVAGKSAAQIGTGALKFYPIVYEGLRDFYQIDNLTGGGRSSMRAWVDAIDASLDQMLPGDKAQSKDFVTELSSGAGSMLGFLVAGYIGGAMGLPAGYSTGILAATSGGTRMFEQAEEFNATSVQKYMALILGAGLSLTEAVPIDRMFLRANAGTGGLIMRLIANTRAGALDEFIQELSQAIGEDFIAKWGAGFDPDRELDPTSWLRQGVVGGITGGAGGTVTSLIPQAGVGEEQLLPIEDQQRIVDTAIAKMQQNFDMLEGMTPDGDGTLEGASPESTAALEVAPGVTLEPVDIETQAVESVDGPEPPPQVVPPTSTAQATPVETGVAPLADTTQAVEAVDTSETVEARVGQTIPAVGGTMPAPRADGKLELTHWARQPRTVLDPTKMGTGPIRGQERKRLVGPEAVPRTYYGVNATTEMTDENATALQAALQAAEKIKDNTERVNAKNAAWRQYQKQQGYIREAENMGNARHTVAVDPNRLYNYYEDPLGLKAGLDRTKPDSEQMTAYERMIRDAGFAGYYISEGPQGQTVALFEAAVPERVVDEKTGVDLLNDEDGDFEARTGTSMFGDDEIKARIKPTGKRGQVVITDVAAALDEDHAANHGRKFYPETDEADFQVVREMAVDELRAQLERPNSGVGWYSKDTQDAIAITSRLFPTLATNPEHRDLFLTYAGIFSNGTDPVQAWQMAAEAFRYYLATGQLPVKRVNPDGTPVKLTTFKSDKTGEMVTKPVGWGVRGTANETLLTFINHLIQREGGIAAAMEWMRTPQLRTEINRAMTESGAFKEGRYKTKASQQGETYGALAFGEKLGRYTLGLHGVPVTAEDTTVDIWYTRTFRRWTGRMTDGEMDAVVNERERQAIFGLTDELVREFDISAGDVQAALWFFEKRLWGELGIRTDEGTNSSGARKLLRDNFGDVDVGATADVNDGARGDGQGDGTGQEAEYEAARVVDADLTPLPGLPKSSTGPIESVVRAARAYAESIGLPIRRQEKYIKADPERGARIAQAYQDMQHNPEDPAVKAAFQAMIDETLAQYQFVKASGLQVEAIEDGKDPYPGGPKEVLADLQSGHLWFFPTESGFGTLSEAEQTNPLLAPTNEFIGDRQLLANDVFRIVHDFFGHGLEGAGFGATGEENAWQAHMRLYTPNALPAVTSETRGQNSWVNFGPYGEQNRGNQRETVYADQKTGLMPSWTWTEGVADDAEFEAARGTSATRTPYKGEQTRPDAGIPTTPQNEGMGENGNLRRISRNFIKLLDLTARQGRLTLKGSDVMGQYSKKSGTIRMRSNEDLSTLVHEGGHAIHDARAGILNTFIQANEAEVIKVGLEHYGDPAIKTYPKAKQIREGFAEFFRLYTLNRQRALRLYPQLTRDFAALLEKEAPAIDKGLNIAGQQFAAYLQAPSVEVVKNSIIPAIRPKGLRAAVKAARGTLPDGVEARGFAGVVQELKEKGFTTWMHELALNGISVSVNGQAALNDLVADMVNLAQKNRGSSLDLKRAEDPRVLARLAPNFATLAFVQMNDGIIPYHGIDPASASLRDAILISQGMQPGKTPWSLDEGRLEDFDAYLVAMRAIDEYRRLAEGKITRPPTLETLGDHQNTVQELGTKYPEFAQAAAMIHEFGMAMWKKHYDAGLIDKETYTDVLDHQFYVPLQRDRSDMTSVFPNNALTGAARLVKRFGGSDRRIVSPTAVLMHKLHSLERAIAENDVKKALAQLADKAGAAGALVERVPAMTIAGQKFTVKEVASKLIDDPSMSPTDAADLVTLLAGQIDKGGTISIFRAEETNTKGEPILFFFDQGKLQAIQLKDGDIGVDVVNMMNGLGRENLPLGIELIAGTSTAFRTFITNWGDFLAVNFARDQVSAWVLNTVGFIPFFSGLRGVAEEVRQSQWARRYNSAMGIMGGMNVAALHKSRVDRDIKSIRAKGYFARAFADDGFTGALKGFARLIEVSETGTRIGLFKKAFERGKADGLTDYEALVEAGYLATDYMDYGMNGSRMLVLRRTIPFLNAQLQGLYKMMRTLGADEVRQRKGLKFVLKAYFKSTKGMDLSRNEKQAIQTGRAAWAKMAILGLFSAAIHFAFEDDEDYQNAGALRDTHWVIPLGDGQIFTIPKPFELALVANAVERGLESASGDTTAKAKFMRSLGMAVIPPISPPGIKTVVEHAANYDFFTGREIVPGHMQALDPVLQYDAYTSELAKQLGEATGLSPLIIEHYMSSLGASAYRDMATMTNMLDPDRPTMDLNDMPIARRFFRDARVGGQSATDFWSQAGSLDGKLRSAEVSYKKLLEADANGNAANRFLAQPSLSDNERAYALLTTHFKPEAKRLNPFYRTRQVMEVLSAMRREMVSDRGLENTDLYAVDPTIKLTATRKAKVIDVLSELGRREMRNTLVATGAPGWTNKTRMPVEPTLEMLGYMEPDVLVELNRRLDKKKVYDAEAVFNGWPEVRDRLLSDREEAYLDDMISAAKVLR